MRQSVQNLILFQKFGQILQDQIGNIILVDVNFCYLEVVLACLVFLADKTSKET